MGAHAVFGLYVRAYVCVCCRAHAAWVHCMLPVAWFLCGEWGGGRSVGLLGCLQSLPFNWVMLQEKQPLDSSHPHSGHGLDPVFE
jgi:hypothetical protein